VEHLGLLFHTVDDQPYWNEAAAYRFEPEEIAFLEAATNELHEMCLAAVRYVIELGDLGRLSIPVAAHQVIEKAWHEKAPTLYGRFDFSYDGANPPKLLEYNADTPTSLLEAAVIQWHWLQEIEPSADQFNSIWDALIEHWKRLRASGFVRSGTVHFGCMDAMEDVMTTAVLVDTAKEAGIEVSLMQMREIGWDSSRRRFVDQIHRPIDALFKLYPWEWMLREEFGPKALRSYDDIQWFEPIWKMVLSNKAILAVLWEMFPNHPNLLPAYLDGPRGMSAYVRKPIFGREGANVSIFGAADPVKNPGPYGQGPYVYQAYAPLPVFEGNHAVVGSWIVDRDSRGIGVRESDGPITEDCARFVPHYFWPKPADAADSNMSGNAMNASVIHLSPIRVVMLRHTGPYEGVSAVFDQLFSWVNVNDVPVQRTIGIYWDNPDFVAASRLRSAACAEVPFDFHLTDRGGLPLTIEEIAGGSYVMTRFVGPYEDLAPVWTELTRYTEHTLGRRISMNPAFEVYVNDASDTPPDRLITELYMPIL
jgi:glutathionylspermidine synthase/effector-binding domain-containing protein